MSYTGSKVSYAGLILYAGLVVLNQSHKILYAGLILYAVLVFLIQSHKIFMDFSISSHNSHFLENEKA